LLQLKRHGLLLGKHADSHSHELIERGFEVVVYDKNPTYVGGKARSVDVNPDVQPKGGEPLPGEHGFRFFPGFYKHITDTMKRIPYQEGPGKPFQKNGCYGNLTPTHRIMLARYDKSPLVTVANFPRTIKDWKVLKEFYNQFVNSGLTEKERKFSKGRVLELATSCKERRRDEYEKLSWWEFLEADYYTETYQHLLAGGLVRTLVAAQAKFASTKTGGNVFLQLIYTMATPGVNTDRVLNGPTNEKWLKPWIKYLEQRGVKYFLNHEVDRIEMNGGAVEQVHVNDGNGGIIKDKGDYYIMAVPVEAAAALVKKSKGMIEADNCLKSLHPLAKSVSWMNGIQFYLNQEVNISDGHIIYSDSEWAVTSISQTQYWKDFDLSKCYNGKVKCIISVDVSDWLNTKFKDPDTGVEKLAKDCTRDEISKFVWLQISRSLNVAGAKVVDDSMIEFYYIDSDIHDADTGQQALEEKRHSHPSLFNLEPLLVNTVHSWTNRPNASSNIQNLFLASDYVRTNTDLATMEGANEAARRAVNCIIDAAGQNQPYCKIWPLSEPWVMLPLKWYDLWRYNRGLTPAAKTPWWLKFIMIFWILAYGIEFFLKALFVFVFG
jgi:uncharacterized protein with NAD-binding domain and iron-sulfur cluster